MSLWYIYDTLWYHQQTDEVEKTAESFPENDHEPKKDKEIECPDSRPIQSYNYYKNWNESWYITLDQSKISNKKIKLKLCIKVWLCIWVSDPIEIAENDRRKKLSVLFGFWILPPIF